MFFRFFYRNLENFLRVFEFVDSIYLLGGRFGFDILRLENGFEVYLGVVEVWEVLR